MIGKKKATGIGATLAMGGILIVPALTASAASAAPVHSLSAQTRISNTGDSGGAGNVWAIDAYDRTLTITETGHTGGVYSYTAHVTDRGTFRTVRGAEDPNSTGHELNAVNGTVSGSADYSFTASALPSGHRNLGVPSAITRNGTYESHDPIGAGGRSSLVPDDAGTSYWYALAFPDGTTFGGSGIGAYSYIYRTGCETWVDASNVAAASAGNITGKLCTTGHRPSPGRHPSPSPTRHHSSPPATARSGHGYVVNTYSNKCLDASNTFGVAKTTTLQLWSCGAASGEDQRFSYTGHTLRYDDRHGNDRYCVSEPATGDRAMLLAPCDSARSQYVTYDRGLYRFRDGRVLDDASFGKADGNPVLVFAYNGGANQSWSLPK